MIFFDDFDDEEFDSFEDYIEMDLLYPTIPRPSSYGTNSSQSVYGNGIKSSGLIDDKVIQQMEMTFNHVSR